MLIDKIERLLNKQSKKLKTLQFSMKVPKLNLNYEYSSTVAEQKFHSASVGKLMTTVLIFKAVEEKRFSLDSKVEDYLDSSVLDHLCVYQEVDYRNLVTIRHLLGHTSGINDYFESKTIDGSVFMDEIIKQPDKFWKPLDLIRFTQEKQKCISIPGEKFLYSDTGFILLGLIIEKVFDQPFHKVLEDLILIPCEMKNTGLCFYSDGFNPTELAPLILNEVDIRSFKSLSCDFSGGGLWTTTADLQKFLQQLHDFQLISEVSVNSMATFNQKFRQGIMYGLGMMQLRFEQFFFLLKSLPRLQGHLGVTGVHAWVDPISHATYVMNVGSIQDMARSFQLLIQIVQMVEKESKKV
ncbi:MAG: serine hydrolase domain-containing protein [Erysipelotrichaceae bacterium]|nr:serine hydrolase domain-containing protein [Erysipelotrichaceae bacterium]MDP3305575.1 serine hydrolase domain-containing protein [Erysipelotrichaceae bacterium]